MQINLKSMRSVFILLLFFVTNLSAQKNKNTELRPKLVVGLVIDQMRYDFLYAFQDRYGEDGLKRLMRDGHNCRNMFINYLPSYTAPGHTCIYTGSVPAIHGIASNDWIDKLSGKAVYCTDDSSVSAVGGTVRAGKMSPRNMLTSTITDELRLATNFASKTIAISVKDRASILPGGHTANGAYWLDDSNGVFMTSTYYKTQLPGWVSEFNAQQKAKKYMSTDWQTLYPLNTYQQYTDDNNLYEGKYTGETTTSFPHKLPQLKASDIKKTPFGNTLVFDFAKDAITYEQLGSGKTCDFLAISCSSPDYIGHQFGPNSVEIEDTYLRLDQDIANFLDFLDKTIGEGQYTIFLSADHGVAHNPQYLIDHKMQAGYFYGADLLKELNNALLPKYASNRLVKQVGENFIWLKHDLIDSLKIDEQNIRIDILKLLEKHTEIQFAVDMNYLSTAILPEPIHQMAINGYHSKRSGDILLLLNPAWLDAYSKTGTTHGTWNPYDTHIPMLWYGWGIQKGITNRQVNMTDIAATLATLLHIQVPNGCIGVTIPEVLK